MSREHIASLLVSATLLVAGAGAAESALPAFGGSGAGDKPAIFAPTALLAQPVASASSILNEPAVNRTRAVSPAMANQLAAAGPRFDPAIAAATAQPRPVEALVDLREIDKPRNTIIRLPNYVVREEKPPVFKERELRTSKGRLELALQRHPGLRLGSFWIFSNDGIARAMLAEEDRLEQKREFEELAELMRFTDPARHSTTKREVQQTFLRAADFGR